VRTNKMLFGTDEDAMRFGDVERFDYGSEPVVNAYNETAQIIDLLPNELVETFIRARAPENPRDRIPLERVNLNYSVAAANIIEQLASALQWFKADSRSVRVENQFDFIGEMNLKERQQAHWKYLNQQVEKLGGVDRALFSPLPPDFKLELKDEPVGLSVVQRVSATNLTARLEKLLTSTNYVTFVGLDEKKYSFTPDERALILQRGKTYFEELEEALVRKLCQKLENAPRDLGTEANDTVSEDDITAKLEQRIIEVARQVIMARVETNRISGRVGKSYVQVPKFKYDFDVRLAAAKMLNEKTGSFKGWADDAKADLNKQLKQQVDEALNLEHFKDFKPSLLSRPLLDWYQQQQEILKLLPTPPPSSPASPPAPAK
jgi:hypothetical protein